MAKDVRFLISANIDKAEQEIRKLQSSGKAVSDSLAGAFESLGIRSTVAIEKEKAASVSAYERIKASGVASAQEIGRAKAALSTTTARLDKEMVNLKQSTDSLGSSFGALAGPGALMAAVAALGMYGKYCIDAALATEKYTAAMQAVSGSATLAAREIQFIREESQRLGLNFVETAGAFAKFTASTKNTVLEGEATRKVFVGVSEAVTALKLSGDESKGIFLALSQMMSKGKVSAEELNGQLGERLPGALKLTADAMGMTTAELMKQMELGKLMSADVLPKLAEQLHKTYGEAAKKSAEGGQAAINRFNNELKETAAQIGSGLMPGLTAAGNKIAGIMKTIRENPPGWLKNWTFALGLTSADVYMGKEKTSSQKSAAETSAEVSKVAEAKATEMLEKYKAAQEKLAKEQEEYDTLIKQREIQRLQDQSKIKHDILNQEKQFASTTLQALQSKKKEIQAIQASFLESDRLFAEQRAQVLGDYSGGFGYLDPNATAQQKASSLKDRMIEQEKEYQQLSDPKEKQQKLVELAGAWGQLTQKIDFANMSQSEKMQQISDIEEQRIRLQTTIKQNAEAEKTALEATYATALEKIRQYKAEVEGLDALIKNMSREITIDMKINKAGLDLVKAGGTLTGGSAQSSAATGSSAVASVNSFDSGYSKYNGYSGSDGYNSYGNNQYGAAGSYNSRYETYSPGMDGLPNGYMAISSTPSYAVGTNYVPNDGLAYLHKGEAVIPAAQNSGGGGVTIQNLTINLPNVSNPKEFARMIKPELDALDSRYRRAA